MGSAGSDKNKKMNDSDIKLALANISNFGDTDIFPFTIERHVFKDEESEIVKLIKEIDSNFRNKLNDDEPSNLNTCSPIGYTGYRWATQVDPIWNAYYLSLVISLAKDIEDHRIPKKLNQVFSYRFKPDNSLGSLFDMEINWRKFQEISLETIESSDYSYVVSCDIADFYTRIYHHRLENELLSLPTIGDKAKKINALLQKFSNGTSYGLPIGGPASRILAELALNRTDKTLQIKGIHFTRFVDDYFLYARSLEEAHSILNFIAIILLKNEGLALQKYKTLILTKSEFSKLIILKIKAETDDKNEEVRSKFMSLPIRYDPYSPTAKEDYKRLQKELNQFDIISLLNQEIRKSKIHQQFSKRLLKAFKYITNDQAVSNAFIAICNNLDIFYPIFNQIIISVLDNLERLSGESKEVIKNTLYKLIETDSYIIQVELNASYLVRLISHFEGLKSQQLLNILYDSKFPNSPLIRSLVMQSMIRWKATFWLSDKKPNFSTMNKWERRIFIIGCELILKDEGEHWIRAHKKGFSKLELIILEWAKSKKSTNWNQSL